MQFCTLRLRGDQMALYANGKKIASLYYKGKKIQSLWYKGQKIYSSYFSVGTILWNGGQGFEATGSYTNSSLVNNKSVPIALKSVKNGIEIKITRYLQGSSVNQLQGGISKQISKTDLEAGKETIVADFNGGISYLWYGAKVGIKKLDENNLIFISHLPTTIDSGAVTNKSTKLYSSGPVWLIIDSITAY